MLRHPGKAALRAVRAYAQAYIVYALVPVPGKCSFDNNDNT